MQEKEKLKSRAMIADFPERTATKRLFMSKVQIFFDESKGRLTDFEAQGAAPLRPAEQDLRLQRQLPASAPTHTGPQCSSPATTAMACPAPSPPVMPSAPARRRRPRIPGAGGADPRRCPACAASTAHARAGGVTACALWRAWTPGRGWGWPGAAPAGCNAAPGVPCVRSQRRCRRTKLSTKLTPVEPAVRRRWSRVQARSPSTPASTPGPGPTHQDLRLVSDVSPRCSLSVMLHRALCLSTRPSSPLRLASR